jgi:hypothetical protein
LREALWKVATVALLAGMVLSSYGALYFQQQAASLSSQNDYLKGKLGAVSETVDIAVNFGNGTLVWLNGTYVPVGASVYNATYVATGGRVATQTYSYGNVTGIFVTGIMGVSGTTTSFWLWYSYSAEGYSWVEAPVGADAYLATQGGIYLWNFTHG